jgi:phage terminase large subunit-like protein
MLGQRLMPWQCEVLDVALEFDPQTGLPAYRQVGVTVPRRSGKTTLLLALTIDRCLAWGRRQRCLYVAQTGMDSRDKWIEQVSLLDESPLVGRYRAFRHIGHEHIDWYDTASWSGITAPGETSGHGFDLDLGMIDEAWAQRDTRLLQGFRPAMMARPAAQLWWASTMGTAESVLMNDLVDDGRARVDAGETSGVAYFEWSAGDDDDPDDPRTWWGCMPALGHTVSEEVIAADHASLDASDFARAYLNRRATAGRPVISAETWSACRDSRSQLRGVPCFALDATPDRSMAAIGVAGYRADRRRHIEIVEHRAGTQWVPERLLALQRRWAPLPVIVDPGGPAGSLLVDLAAAGVSTETLSAREYAQAAGQFYDAVTEGGVRHLEQPVLGAAVASARKRVLGDSWAWARRSGSNICPLVAVTLAHWGLVKAGQGVPQIF